MNSKKVVILNNGLLENDVGPNKDNLRSEIGSWRSKTIGFQFDKRSDLRVVKLRDKRNDTDITIKSSPPETIKEDSDFYRFKQKITFASSLETNPNSPSEYDQKEDLRSRVSGLINKNPEFYYEDFATEMRIPIAKEEVLNLKKSTNVSGFAGVDFVYVYEDRAYEKLVDHTAVTEVVVPSMYAQVTNLKNLDDDIEVATLKAPSAKKLMKNLERKPKFRKFKKQMVVGDPLDAIAPYDGNKQLFPFYAEVSIPLGLKNATTSGIQESDLGAVLMRDIAEHMHDDSLESVSSEKLSYSVDYLTANDKNKAKSFTVNFNTVNLNDWWSFDLPAWASVPPPSLPRTSMFISPEASHQEDLASRGAKMWGTGLDADIYDAVDAAWVATLGVPTLQGKLTQLMAAHARTYDEFSSGQSAYSESVMYKIAKYRGLSTKRKPTQEFYIYNSTDDTAGFAENRILSFIDTQLKLDSVYTYVVTEFRAIVGTKYRYDFSTMSSADEMRYNHMTGQITGTMNVIVEPVVKLVEVPLFISKGRVLSPPPMPPDVEAISYKGVANKMLFLFDSHVGETQEEPISFGPYEAIDNKQYLRHDKTSVDGEKIQYRTTSGIEAVEVFRMVQRPTEIEDFRGKLLKTVTTNIGKKRYIPASSAGELIKQKPNKKFYYMFRSINFQGARSNPSPVYEIELYNDGGAAYPIVRTIELREVKSKTKTRSFRNLLRITPRITQATVNEEASGLINEDGSLGNARAKNIVLGNEDEALFGKRFKVRLTSKQTGRKIDLNVSFKTIVRHLPGTAGASADIKAHTVDIANISGPPGIDDGP